MLGLGEDGFINSQGVNYPAALVRGIRVKGCFHCGLCQGGDIITVPVNSDLFFFNEEAGSRGPVGGEIRLLALPEQNKGRLRRQSVHGFVEFGIGIAVDFFHGAEETKREICDLAIILPGQALISLMGDGQKAVIHPSQGLSILKQQRKGRFGVCGRVGFSGLHGGENVVGVDEWRLVDPDAGFSGGKGAVWKRARSPISGWAWVLGNPCLFQGRDWRGSHGVGRRDGGGGCDAG